MVYKSGQIFLPFCHNSRVWRTSDGQTKFSSLDRVCVPCSAVKIWTDLSSVLSQCTRLTDRQTDKILIINSIAHYKSTSGFV